MEEGTLVFEIVDDEPYARLEEEVDRGESTAIKARWLCGKRMVAEREENGGKQLPNGRLAMLVRLTGKCKSELEYRMQFAEQYLTEDEVSTAVETCGSWTEVRRTLGRRPRAEGPRQDASLERWPTAATFASEDTADEFFATTPAWIGEFERFFENLGELSPCQPTRSTRSVSSGSGTSARATEDG